MRSIRRTNRRDYANNPWAHLPLWCLQHERNVSSVFFIIKIYVFELAKAILTVVLWTVVRDVTHEWNPELQERGSGGCGTHFFFFFFFFFKVKPSPLQPITQTSFLYFCIFLTLSMLNFFLNAQLHRSTKWGVFRES